MDGTITINDCEIHYLVENEEVFFKFQDFKGVLEISQKTVPSDYRKKENIQIQNLMRTVIRNHECYINSFFLAQV